MKCYSCLQTRITCCASWGDTDVTLLSKPHALCWLSEFNTYSMQLFLVHMLIGRRCYNTSDTTNISIHQFIYWFGKHLFVPISHQETELGTVKTICTFSVLPNQGAVCNWISNYRNGEGPDEPYGLCSPSMTSACLCLWKNFSQRISLIRETITCRNKGDQVIVV